MSYFYIISSSNDLQHHGILGQKWGIRRFQNKDGSLTSAGRKRYDDDGTSDSKSSSSDRKAKTKSVAKKVAIAAGVTASIAAVAGVSYLVYKKKSAGKINTGKKAAESVANKTVSELQKAMQNRNASMNKVMSQFDALDSRLNAARNGSRQSVKIKTPKVPVPKVTKQKTSNSGNLSKELEKRRRAMEKTMSAFDRLDRAARR